MAKPISFYLCGAAKAAVAPFLYAVSFIIPRDKNRIVFGAWQGKLYADNSKYFMLYVLEHTDMHVTWIGEPQIEALLPKHKNLHFAVKDSPYAIWSLLRAKTWVFCWGLFFDLTSYPLRGQALCINLWHGIPVKYVGRKSFNGRNHRQQDTLLGTLLSSVMHLGGDWGYLSTASDLMTDLLADGIPTVFLANRVIKSGTPRNDFLINNAHNDQIIANLRTKYAKLLGFAPTKRIITYLPTHRNDGEFVQAFFNFSEQDQVKIKAVLDRNNAVLIEKHHFLTLLNFPESKPSICSISIPAAKQSSVDVQELLLITDLLICDYSGAYIDYSLLKRPQIHFAYDYVHYKTLDSGLAYPLEEYAAGPIASNTNELILKLEQLLSKPSFDPRKNAHELVEYEQGHASESLLNFILTS